MTRYVIAPEARHDLLSLWDFIADHNLDAADRVRDELFAAFERLADWPNLGRRYEGAAMDLRAWRVRDYLVFYRPETRPLEIVRILSVYRDIPRILE